MSFILLFTTLVTPAIATDLNNNIRISSKDVEKAKEIKLEKGKYSDEDILIKLKEDDGKYIVDVYFDDEFDHQVITDKKTGDMKIQQNSKNIRGINEIQNNMKTHNVEEYLTNIGNYTNKNTWIKLANNEQIINSSKIMPILPILKSSNSDYTYVKEYECPHYNLTGYLYKKYAEYDYKDIDVSFVAGTLIGVIVSVISPLFMGTLTIETILSAFGTSLVSGAITNAIFGKITSRVKGWIYEIRGKGKIFYGRDRRFDVYALVENYDTMKIDEVYQGKTGWDGTDNEMIDYHIHEWYISAY